MLDLERSEECAGDAGAVSDRERFGSLVIVGARGSSSSSGIMADSCGGSGGGGAGAVKGRQREACGTAVV